MGRGDRRSRGRRSRSRSRDRGRDRYDHDRSKRRREFGKRDADRSARRSDNRRRRSRSKDNRKEVEDRPYSLAAQSRDHQKRSRRNTGDEIKKGYDDSYEAFQKVMGGAASPSPKAGKSSPAKRSQPSKDEDTPMTSKGAGATPARKPPVELEALEKVAKRKKALDVGVAKPVFLTKKQRQELALKRLEERRAAERKRQEELAKKREEFVATSSSSSRGSRDNYHRRSRRDDDRSGRYDRGRDRDARDRRVSSSSSSSSSASKTAEDRVKEKMLEVIKQQYLGKKVKKKRVVPPSQKFKFSFDWEPSEDTSQDIDPLYASRHNGSLLFGRGFVGGVDRREQIKKNKFYRKLMEDRQAGKEDLRDQDKVKARKERERKRDLESRLAGRHWSEKKLEEMEERDWRIFREDFNISTRGNRVPHPVRYWKESGLPKKLLEALDAAGYKDPTPIQRAALPIGLGNRDCVGIAATGSGKTAAFLLPMLVYISTLPPMTEELAQQGPYALILAPTRELAQQIAEECEKFGGPMGIRSVSIVGGMSYQDQGFKLRLGAEVVIATPGRLFDTIERRYLVLNQCNYIVLDEADRMIDMNFEPQILKIMDMMPSSNLRPLDEDDEDEDAVYRQTFMFSATMPLKVEMLAKKYLRNPVYVAIGSRSGQAARSVEQQVIMMSEGAKRKKLLEVLQNAEPPIIVFCNAKKACDVLGKFLSSNGRPAVVLHGGKVQEQRMNNLAAFKDGHYDVLVATDVVGRGIDISGVTLVVNYDVPSSIERYMHRVGRTGRAGKKGRAVSFLTNDDTDIMYDLKAQLQASGNHVPHELSNHPAAKTKPGTITQKGKFKM